MSYMSQNFRLFHASNLFVLNFLIFLLVYSGVTESAVKQDETRLRGRAAPVPVPLSSRTQSRN